MKDLFQTGMAAGQVMMEKIHKEYSMLNLSLHWAPRVA